MKYDLSILIPARNEEFLNRTIQDILQNIQGKTEIIVILDGQWSDPPIEDNPDITIIYHSESIGQRAATNEACRLSKSKYVMKVDAHCSFDKGFDVKMMKEMKNNWTMVPLMRNLHCFDWICQKCGNRTYQGPTPLKCEKCGGKMKKDIVWIAKPSPRSTSYRFDRTLHFQYWGEYKKKQKGDLVETMSLQGSCFMMTRKKYLELNICDESWGSWGNQGLEVSAKTHMADGKVICNKKTWYAHMFRTQGGDFSFPYPQSGNAVERARQSSRDLFRKGNYEKAIYPLSWVIEKFSPVPEWDEKEMMLLKKEEMESKRAGIYLIKCSGNNKVYIGSAEKLSRRFNAHLEMLFRSDHKNKYLQSAWDKYGEDSFSFQILRFCEKKDLLKYEQEFIDKYKKEIGWDNMFNLNPDAKSWLGREHSEESKEKMRESSKGQVAWNKDKSWSEEVKEKISLANTGKEAWSKGLTKETDERLKAISDNMKGKVAKWKNGHPKGMLGKKHSEESKKKIGLASSNTLRNEEWNKKNSEAHKGKIFSEEHKKNMSLAQKKLNSLRDEKGQYTGQFLKKGIVYYTDNQLKVSIAKKCQNQLKKMGLPIVSVSLKPMNFGKNIYLDLKRGYLTMFKQILVGLEASESDIVFFCEADVLYHPSHFDFVPPKKDAFYYNLNVYKWKYGEKHFLKVDDCKQTSGLCAYRELLVGHYRRRVAKILRNQADLIEIGKPVKNEGFSRHMGFEPGCHTPPRGVDDFKAESWKSKCPNVDIRHTNNLTPNRWTKEEFRNPKFTEGWTEAKEIPCWKGLV